MQNWRFNGLGPKGHRNLLNQLLNSLNTTKQRRYNADNAGQLRNSKMTKSRKSLKRRLLCYMYIYILITCLNNKEKKIRSSTVLQCLSNLSFTAVESLSYQPII